MRTAKPDRGRNPCRNGANRIHWFDSLYRKQRHQKRPTFRRLLWSLELDTAERLILDQLLVQWDLWDQQLKEVDRRIKQRFAENEDAQLLATTHGVSRFMALAIARRIGSIARFPRGRSQANFFGLTPSSNSSGDAQRLGSISKEGNRMVRYLLGQLVLNQLRRDGDLRKWYQQIKRRRGSKIARVAVMRRLAVVFWHMLQKRQAGQSAAAGEAISFAAVVPLTVRRARGAAHFR